MSKITFKTGLDISMKILKILKKDKSIKGIEVYVGCFTNSREVGLTYAVENKKHESFTFCTYEHRNSDCIIINGKEGYVSSSDELPYISDSKWECLGCAGYEQYDEAAKILAKLIKDFHNGKTPTKCN